MIANCQRASLVACLLLALLSAQAAPLKYTCQILDQRFDQAYGWALNEAGKVAGFDAGAARWSRMGKRVDLPGAVPNEGAEAFGINGAGRVVGYSGLAGFPELATVWDGKQQTTLPPLPGGAAAVAYTLNDAGLIAGAGTFDGAEVMHAVVWEGGAPANLGALGSGAKQAGRPSYVSAMNEAGNMVGSSQVDDEGNWHAVFWGADRQILDLGALPGHVESSAHGINSAGTIVGSSGPGSQLAGGRPVVWIDKVIRALPTAQSGQESITARSINASGQIVGKSDLKVAIEGGRFKFLGTALFWPSADEMPIDLNTVTGRCAGKRKAFIAERLVWAAGINDKGMILVEIQDFQHHRRWSLRTAVLRPVR